MRGASTMNSSPQQFSHYPAIPPPADVAFVSEPEHPCPYLPGRSARSRAFWAAQMAPAMYEEFMNAGFRRSGNVLYQPVCRGCRACLPIRVPVLRFRPNKSQRRCRRRNADLRISSATPVATDEKFELYRRYLRDWHGGTMEDNRTGFEQFLYQSPVESLESCYRDPEGRLLAVGICDVGPASLSSVYFYFDPVDAIRGLGTFGVLCEIEDALRLRLRHYYLGYWVSECDAMEYKSSFRPNELLDHDQVWREAESDVPAPSASLRHF